MTTKEQVIAMAREASVYTGVTEWTIKESETFVCEHDAIHRFATLVGNAAVIEERMALAQLCDAMGSPQIAEYLRAQAEIIRKEPTT